MRCATNMATWPRRAFSRSGSTKRSGAPGFCSKQVGEGSPSRANSRGVIEHDHPTAGNLAKNQREDAVRPIACALEPPSADDKRRIGGKHVHAKIGETEGAHLRASCIFRAVVCERLVPARHDLVTREKTYARVRPVARHERCDVAAIPRRFLPQENRFDGFRSFGLSLRRASEKGNAQRENEPPLKQL